MPNLMIGETQEVLALAMKEFFSGHDYAVERVWQKDFGLMEDTVRTHVRTLRKKIDYEGHSSIITTIRGLGYKTENRI